jgi:hypothetical protein
MSHSIADSEVTDRGKPPPDVKGSRSIDKGWSSILSGSWQRQIQPAPWNKSVTNDVQSIWIFVTVYGYRLKTDSAPWSWLVHSLLHSSSCICCEDKVCIVVSLWRRLVTSLFRTKFCFELLTVIQTGCFWQTQLSRNVPTRWRKHCVI